MKTIPIGGKKANNRVIVVDDEDHAVLNRYSWYMGRCGVPFAHIRGRNIHIPVHRLLLNPPGNKDVDHINGDTLDNRKENLRICSHSENSKNQGLHKNNTSGYKGVSWNKMTHKWESYIKINYKRIGLGYYENKVDAAKAYNEAAIKHFGDFSRLNPV